MSVRPSSVLRVSGANWDLIRHCLALASSEWGYSSRSIQSASFDFLLLALGANGTGADGKVVKTGPVTVDTSDKTTIIVPLAGPLPDGKYIVDWQAVSADSHKVKGTYRFESMK